MTTATPPALPEVPTDTLPDSALPEIDFVSIEEINLDIPNHRKPLNKIRLIKLAQSIAEQGLQSPIILNRPSKKKTGYSIVFGHRRLDAVNLLGWPTIKAEIREGLTTEQILALRAIENLQREDLTAVERMDAVTALHAETGDVNSTAQQLNFDVREVEDLLYISDRMTKPVRKLALAVELTVSHLRELVKLGDPMQQWAAAVQAVGGLQWWVDMGGKPGNVDNALDGDLQQIIDDSAEGTITRLPVRELREIVVGLQRSLDKISWKYELPVMSTKKRLRACKGCPDNSATDTTLFGDDQLEDDARGRCHNAGCYELKKTAVEDAKTALLKKFGRRSIMPSNEDIDEIAPPWLKDNLAKSTVRRRIKENAGSKAAARDKDDSVDEATGGHATDADTPLAVAIAKYKKDYEAWAEESGDRIGTKILSKPQLLLAELLLPEFAYTSWNRGDAGKLGAVVVRPDPIPSLLPADVALLKRWAVMAKIEPGALPPELLKQLKLDTRLPDHESPWSSEVPLVIAGIATVLEVDLDDAPLWSDYDPANATTKADPLPRAKKKTTKKKKAKK